MCTGDRAGVGEPSKWRQEQGTGSRVRPPSRSQSQWELVCCRQWLACYLYRKLLLFLPYRLDIRLAAPPPPRSFLASWKTWILCPSLEARSSPSAGVPQEQMNVPLCAAVCFSACHICSCMNVLRCVYMWMITTDPFTVHLCEQAKGP